MGLYFLSDNSCKAAIDQPDIHFRCLETILS
jgi:hypothetical protein